MALKQDQDQIDAIRRADALRLVNTPPAKGSAGDPWGFLVKVETTHAVLTEAMNSEKVTAAIEATIQAARDHARANGVLVDPMLRGRESQRLTDAAREQAKQFLTDHAAAVTTVDTIKRSYETLQLDSEAYTGHDLVAKATLRMADATERHGVYVRFQGRTLGDLARAYEAANDTKDRLFRRMVEDDAAEGFRSFPLTKDGDGHEAAALLRLRKVMQAARAARVPSDVTAAEGRLKKLMTASLDAKIRLLLAQQLHLV
jgi:hypothetical protein